MNFNYCKSLSNVKEDLASHMEKECTWRHYNLSVNRIFKNVDPYGQSQYLLHV